MLQIESFVYYKCSQRSVVNKIKLFDPFNVSCLIESTTKRNGKEFVKFLNSINLNISDPINIWISKQEVNENYLF